MNISGPVYSTKTEWVLNAIRESIIEGIYEPGQKLGLKQLAEYFNVSEQPVRAALNYLQAEGLISRLPHSGAEVTKLEPTEVKEIFEIRGMLEAYSLTALIEKMDSNLMSRLEEKMIIMKHYMEQEDGLSFGRVNKEFHTLLHSKSNKMIQDMIVGCWQRTRSHFKSYPQRSRNAYEEHCLILQAIKDKDVKKAQDLMKEHLANVVEYTEKVLVGSIK